MLLALHKVIFSIIALAASLYSIRTFEAGFWSVTVIGIAVLVLLSVFIQQLHPLAVIMAKISGLLALFAFLLLLLAGTIGGSFHLSESNQIFAFLLFTFSLFGISAFLWPINTHDT